MCYVCSIYYYLPFDEVAGLGLGFGLGFLGFIPQHIVIDLIFYPYL